MYNLIKNSNQQKANLINMQILYIEKSQKLPKEIKECIWKRRYIPYSAIKRVNFSILPKLTYKFNTIPIKINVHFFLIDR